MQSIKQRRFNFFDKQLVKDPLDSSKNFTGLKNLNIKFSLSGREKIILGTVNGSIITLDKHIDVNSYQLFDIDMTCMAQFKNENILVAGGHDSSNASYPVVKVLKLDKMDEPNMRPITIVLSQPNSSVTALAVNEGTNTLVVGLSGGEVLFFKSDILKYKNEKPRLIHEAPHSITALAFKNINKFSLVYLATEHTIITILLGGKDKDEKRPLSSDDGAKFKCWTVTEKSQFIVARKEAVFLYEHDGLGPCYPFEGEKISVHWFRGKLVIVAKDNQNASISRTAMATPPMDMSTVSIYDIENRYVGYSGSFSQVTTVVCEWGSVYVLANKGENLYQLTEKDTQSKLEILYKKHLYQMAIDLAQSSQYDQEGVIDITRQYADHLYGKGDFDNAINQYKKTIGYLEPSYIIRKFLDSQRMVNLTDYLQELHKLKLANEDHTTLLLNCYTKLKDETRLNTFLKQQNIEFDVDTAIKVLRQSGFFKQALQLCEEHAKHEDYLKIQLENSKEYTEALSYIKKLDNQSAVLNLKKYGKLLMANIPEETVEFLKNLCSIFDSITKTYVADPTEFIHIFLKNSSELIEFLEHIHTNKICSSKIIGNTLLELYINSFSDPQKFSKASGLDEAKNFLQEVAGGVNFRSSLTKSVSLKEKRALEFLTTNCKSYDMNLAFIICQRYNFGAGMLYLYEKNDMHQRILQCHMDNNDYLNILDTCKRYGNQDSSLWIQALQYFSKCEQYNCKEFIMQIITNIERLNLLEPLKVIKILSQNSTLTIDTVKEYLLKRMRKEEKEIEEDQEIVNQHLKSIMSLKSEIDHLKTEPIIFQANRCEYCDDELNFPSIHCLCNHSFHADCFANHNVDEACPTCADENRKFMYLIKQNAASKENLHDAFHKSLERSIDKFEVIADYLGKGLFNKPMLVTDD